MIIHENSKPTQKMKAWYLFTEDFISGTIANTNEEVGIYIRLLCFNWNKRCAGIPNDSNTQYRIANCFTDNEKKSCDKVIKEFFVLVNDHYQNERQLQEYLYISRRMEASKQNGKLGGRPKKPSIEPSQNPPTTTPTSTSIKKKREYHNLFNMFWDKVSNKVSKGIAEKNYIKLEEQWIDKPQVLAQMYNNYYESIEDKQFAKQPAFWLSAKKYLDDQPKKEKDNGKLEPYDMRLKMFKEAIENKTNTSFIKTYARQHSGDVSRAIKEGHFSKQQAIELFELEGWI